MKAFGSSNNTATNSSAATPLPTNAHAPYTYREVDNSTPRSSHSRSVMYTRDWRSALRTPPTYRIGNRTFRFNYHFALLVFSVLALFLLFFYVRTGSTSSSDIALLRSYTSKPPHEFSSTWSLGVGGDSTVYNGNYPLTKPLLGRGGIITFRIAMVADLDVNSKYVKDDGSTVWRSYLKKGYLSYTASTSDLKIKWDAEQPALLESGFALKGRGMELSELVTFNGKLLSFDDRTGLIYELVNDKPIPWVILLDGDGHNAKGFKAEWATVKQQVLYVGSMGKEWTTSTGEFENENPMFVKAITAAGEVRSLDWSYNYKMLRQESLQIKWPGYMIHESGVWSEVHQKWYFLPRRCSKEKYNETRDEHMGCNVLISSDDRFSHFESVPLDGSNTKPTHGFASFKFVPGTDDAVIVAIKSEELDGKTTTFITAFNIAGKTLLAEQHIDTDLKYEGIEFI